MKKKVLFVATVVKTHMMQFHIPYLKMLQEMGWETAVAAKNDYEDPADCVIPYCDTYYNIPFARLPWKKDNLRSYRMLKEIIQREDYDVIHCHTPVGGVVARLAALSARKRGTKVVYTAHGFHFFTGGPLVNWLLYYPVEKLLAPVTDVLITMNREDYHRAKKHFHAGRIEYVPGVGLDTGKFASPALNPGEKRRELGFGPEDFLLLTVAEMTKNKNHTTVLKALAELKGAPEFDRLHYLIVGRGEQWPALEAESRALGLEEHVHFLGYRADAAQLYRCCDLFVFLPFREGLSLALMEAMSSGIPILCTQIRGNTDLIDDNISGVFAENDPVSVAEDILALLRSPEKRKSLGLAAQEKVKAFDESVVHEKMRQIYTAL